MSNGKRIKANKYKKTVLALALALVLVAAGGTIAWLATNTNSVTNTFVPAKVTNEVREDVTSSAGVKKNVTVQNTGDVDAYIRADIIVNWVKVDANGEVTSVYAAKPVLNVDYSCELNDSTWKAVGDYYYYTKRVAPNGSTDALITQAKPLKAGPDGCQLQITVISESIQADGVDSKGNKPVELAWNVDIVGGNVVDATIVS